MDPKQFINLSALTGGGGRSSGSSGSSLNKQLSASLRGGKEVFSVAFGEKTRYKTKAGEITVMFTFDPDASYNSSYYVASMIGDFINVIQKKLSAFMIPDVYKKQDVSVNALCWAQFRKTIPSKVLNEYFKRHQGDFKMYTDWVASEVDQQSREDKAMTDALNNKEFSFVFQLGIDAYPSEDEGSKRKYSSSSSSSKAPIGSRNRKGVLTFYIQGAKANADASAPAPAPASSSSASAAAEDSKYTSKSTAMDVDGAAPSSSSSASAVTPLASSSAQGRSLSKQAKQNLAEFRNITKRLGLDRGILKHPRTQCKEFRTSGVRASV
jgi:hypothetical protein